MIRKSLISLCLMASPALAEPFSDKGYALGCDEGGCTIYSAGYMLYVTPDGGTPAALYDQLASLDMVTAVDVTGTLGELGDMTAPLALTGLTLRKDDLYQDTLRYIQGNWKPKGEESLFEVQVYGLFWQEIVTNEAGATFLMSPGETCADGVAPGGIALSLLPYDGSDPMEAACWQVEFASDTELTLRDFTGDQGQVIFERVTY